MSMHHDEDDELQQALRALGQEQGSFQQARALEQRLLATLGAEALAAPIGAARVGLSRQWWMLGIGALVGIGVLLGRPQHASFMQDERALAPRAQPVIARSPTPIAPAPLPPAPLPPAPLVPEAAVSLDLATPQVTPDKPTVSRTPQPRSTRRVDARPPVTSQPVVSARALQAAVARTEDELSLLRRSRASLREDAAAALELADQHARDYPAGLFVQEREMLAIQALFKQRRDAEAVVRAERFVTEYSASAYASRIREMLHTSARVVATLQAPERDHGAP